MPGKSRHPPSARATKLITAAAPNEVALPQIEQIVEDPTALLGVGLAEFGDGFGLGGSGAGMGGGQFFGVQAKGNAFVYVIDGSTSMRSRGKWETCKRELIRSVRRLRGSQRFYVYIFSRDTVRMFDSARVPMRLEPVTSENVKKMEDWLNRYQLTSGTYPRSAVVEALEKLRPDVVYLLSDGEFADGDRTEEYVLSAAKKSSRMPKINTIAFQTQRGQEVLKRIAEATGGQYTYVGR